MKKIIYIGCVALAMSACGLLEKRQYDNVAAEVNGHQLTFAQLDEITQNAESAEDSAQMAETYIRQWATQILEYDEARDRETEEMKQLVEDYKRSLYVHVHEEKMVSRYCPKEWPDSVVAQVYAANQNRLRLRESIVKGVLVVVPKGTPKIDYLKKWMTKLNDANIEKIEKYAYQYASGYEYFPEEWYATNQLLLRLPIENDIFNQHLSKHSQIVMEDSTSVYILQVTDKRMSGEVMPREYAKGAIGQILVSKWQVDYLKKYRTKLYDEAVRFNKVKRYEQNENQ
ncbi:MAG: hypothetical protein MJZ64_05090 [Paludibacteraceae bacterium]|nr:hypothetical protein [Paludibacteraceae bacterium]